MLKIQPDRSWPKGQAGGGPAVVVAGQGDAVEDARDASDVAVDECAGAEDGAGEVAAVAAEGRRHGGDQGEGVDADAERAAAGDLALLELVVAARPLAKRVVGDGRGRARD